MCWVHCHSSGLLRHRWTPPFAVRPRAPEPWPRRSCLQDADFHARAATFPLDFVVSCIQSCPIEGHRIGKLQVGFRSGKGAGGQQQSQPKHQTLRHCRELHDCSFFFSESRRGTVGAARFTTCARKLLCSAANRLQCSRWGSADKPKGSVALCNGGFLIWAAKPSVRESPNPAKTYFERVPPASPLRRLPSSTTTKLLHRKFQFVPITRVWTRSAHFW